VSQLSASLVQSIGRDYGIQTGEGISKTLGEDDLLVRLTCIFHSQPIADSTLNRSVIPEASDH